MVLEDLGSQTSSGITQYRHRVIWEWINAIIKMSPKRWQNLMSVAVKMLSSLYFWRTHNNIDTHLDRTLWVARQKLCPELHWSTGRWWTFTLGSPGWNLTPGTHSRTWKLKNQRVSVSSWLLVGFLLWLGTDGCWQLQNCSPRWKAFLSAPSDS